MDEVWKIIGICGGVSAVVGAIVWYSRLVLGKELHERIYRLEAVDAAQEFKLKVVWDWLMRRSIQEGLEKGVLSKNSPLLTTPMMQDLLRPIEADLRQKWIEFKGNRNPDDIPDYEAEIFFAHHFGDFLLKNVCVPLGLEHGSCLKAAIIHAKSPDAPQLVEVGR